MRFVPEIKAYPPPVQSIVQLQRKVKVWREPVNDKEKVANQIREQIRSGDEPTVQTLLSWARMLEQSEQQTPQSPDGRDCSGESSVQPAAIIDRVRRKIRDKENRLIELANELSAKGKYGSAWRVRNQLFGMYDGLYLAEDSIKELQIEHEAKFVAAG